MKLYPEIVLDEKINKSRDLLTDLLSRVNKPREDDDLGLVLEELAHNFLESPYLKLNSKRRRCETGEIDLDFTVKRIEATLFFEFSYLLIVECKNWQKTVGACELRTFCSKMRDVDANIGIFFATNGITKDAKQIIRNAWVKDKIVVITFDAKELDKIINKRGNFYEILNQKYLSVRTASSVW
ncbi:restriction endonuclease [Synechococcus elongatus]|uniref:restriction endonuclease n=1 Tax=Synechococcus elongatus TaxID=32046 RepID=UPI001FF63951|nr:restriction endonuclease [Synechococcus elongatus]